MAKYPADVSIEYAEILSRGTTVLQGLFGWFLPTLLLPASKPASRKWHVLAPLLALLGGNFWNFGCFLTEVTHTSLLDAYFAAPIIEEALTPSGLYLMMAKWPRVFRGRMWCTRHI